MRIVVTIPAKVDVNKFMAGNNVTDRRDQPLQVGDHLLKVLISFKSADGITVMELEVPPGDAQQLMEKFATANSQKDEKEHVLVKVALDTNFKLADCRNPEKQLLEQPCPYGMHGLLRPTAEHEDVQITAQMVQDYRDDLLLLTTFCNEAEAYLLAQKLGVTFVICRISADDALEQVLTVGRGNAQHYLLHGVNHYTVLERDDAKGTYKLGPAQQLRRYREGLKTRVDGSCLVDACHIARHDRRATDPEVLEYRKWLSEKLDDTVIRATLTTIIIDSMRGIPVAGLGPKVQKHYDAVPRRERALRLISGSPNPIVWGKAAHLLMQKLNAHRGPLVFRRHDPPPDPEPSRLGKRRGPPPAPSEKAAPVVLKTLATDPVDAAAIIEALHGEADTLKVPDGAFAKKGAFTLVCTCDCEKCLWAMVEVRIVSVDVVDDDPIEVLLGSEFSFTNDAMKKASTAADVIETDANVAAQDLWRQRLVEKKVSPETVVRKPGTDDESKHIRLTYPNGWWFQVSLDVSCLELQACPITLTGLGLMRDQLARDIFDFAKALSLAPDAMVGGGHMHLGLDHTFRGDAKLFRNFVVDFYNHPLAMEVLDNDPTNAPVLAQLPRRCQEAFRALLEKLDPQIASRAPGEDGTDLIELFAAGMRDNVLTFCYHEDFDPPSKLQGLCFGRISGDTEVQARTLEIRSIRAQRSIDEFILLGQLFEARLNYLRRSNKGQKDLVVYRHTARTIAHSDPSAILSQWESYVEGCGLPKGPYVEYAKANLKERPAIQKEYANVYAAVDRIRQQEDQ